MTVRLTSKRRLPLLSEAERDRLLAEYRAWRAEAGLKPPALVELRFRRWQRYLARQCGVMFAPWVAAAADNAKWLRWESL